MRGLNHALSMMILLLFLGGCMGIKTVLPPRETPKSGEAILNLVVEWERLESSLSNAVGPMAFLPDVTEVTHIGARLIYPSDNAVFMQSKERLLAENEGVISMKVPASDAADLFVVAVSTSPDRAIKFGVLKNLVIMGDAVLEIRTDDINWSDPSWWTTDPDDMAAIENGLLYGDKDQQRLEIPITIHDPFQTGQKLDRNQTILRIAGNSGTTTSDASTHTRSIIAYCINNRVGEAHESNCSVRPFAAGELFNLPKGYYFLQPEPAPFTVMWQ